MRRLSADEGALWARVIATIAPLEGRVASGPPTPPRAPAKAGAHTDSSGRANASNGLLLSQEHKKGSESTRANTLDGGWDRRLTRGIVEPSMAVDLHGHTLASAHALLDAALDRAVRDEHRLVLLVTGKPRDDGSGRGAIARAVRDWLAASRFAGRIAAVRTAHPRHGGTGALYIVMRRQRT